LSAVFMYLVAAYQSTNFSYHQLPAATLAMLALLVVGMNLDGMRLPAVPALRRVPGALPVMAAAGAALLLAGFTIDRALQPPARLHQAEREQLVELLARHAAGGAAFFMSTSIIGFPSINLARVDSASRYSCLWMAPGIYLGTQPSDPFPYHDRRDQGPVERTFIDSVVADVQRNRPTVVVNHVSPLMQGFGTTTFDFLDYFSRDERFADFFSDFRKLRRVGDMDVYVRSTSAEQAASRAAERG
jgi:hypothetical protein